MQQLFCHPARFRDLALLTIADFFSLHHQLHEAIDNIRSDDQEASPHSHPMPTRLNSVEQLLLWLVYMEEVGVKSLSWVFGLLSINTLHRHVDHVTTAINTDLHDEVSWPSAQERESLYGYFSIHRQVVAVLDGTHCQIEEPTYDSQLYFSGYKGFTSQSSSTSTS